jgi:hypothetical protein
MRRLSLRTIVVTVTEYATTGAVYLSAAAVRVFINFYRTANPVFHSPGAEQPVVCLILPPSAVSFSQS